MIRVIHTRCQPWLYKNARCRLCADACPIKDCIGFKENAVSVDTALCIGCGICTNACPTSALVFENLSDKELLNRLQAAINSEIQEGIRNFFNSIGCSLGQKTGNPPQPPFNKGGNGGIINLPCLAILKESHLVSMVLYGNNPTTHPLTKSTSFPPLKKGDEGGLSGVNIYLDMSHCNECSFKHGKETIEKTVSYANNLLNAMGYEDCVKTDISHQTQDTNPKSPFNPPFEKVGYRGIKKQNIKTIAPEPEYSRRELLSFFKVKAVEKAVDLSLNVSTLNTCEDKSIRERATGNKNIKKGRVEEREGIPERRKILVDGLKGDNILQSAQVEDGEFPVHQIKIEGKCTLCRICSLFCPTSAISRVEGDSEVRLDFNMSLCMNCFECAELCPEGAMDKEKTINLIHLCNNETRTLFRKKSEACPSCSGTFFSEDGVEECIVCRKKNHMDGLMFGMTFKNIETLEDKLF